MIRRIGIGWTSSAVIADCVTQGANAYSDNRTIYIVIVDVCNNIKDGVYFITSRRFAMF